MKLDDRPVIDQITEPSATNVLYEVLRVMEDRVYDAEASLVKDKRVAILDPVLMTMDDEGVSDPDNVVHDTLREVIGLDAAYEANRTLEALRQFAEEIDARLDGVA